MRVLIVSHHAFPHVGGLEALVDLEVRTLVHLGHTIVHVTSDLGGAGHVPHYGAGVRQIRVPAWHVLERRFQVPYPLFSPRLVRVLWEETGRCDVVHAHGFLFMSSVLALALAWIRGVPVRLLTDHGGVQRYHARWVTALARIGAWTVGRLTTLLATRLVAYNTRVLRDLHRLAGPGKPSLFLPYPVDEQIFRAPDPGERASARRRLGWQEDAIYVLFVGRLIADKGVRLVCDARRADWKLVFCGPGDARILPRGEASVHYYPPRPRPQLVELYHAADVLVLPSAREGFPLVVREALACGLRAVLAYEPGYEAYRHLPGLFFCQREPSSIREAIERALQDTTPSELIAAGQRGSAPSPEAWVSQLYADALGRKTP
ncbi:MAG: hypothetical protein C4297_01675 [Gemmataceae bacterium]